jgi:transcriptional regulator with PAS, ATPase and Fis domain
MTAEATEVAAAICARANERWKGVPPLAIVGSHPKFTMVLERLTRLAESDSPVLITGETGTGKELFARGLYLLSIRNTRPFLRVNCAQYHDTQLLASELFGHKKGSFTGALTDQTGLFEAAHHGMIFLDEVTELSLPAQAMLLRVLSEGEIVPVGETAPRIVNVRVVAATSNDVAALVERGEFRRDLYYRLRGGQLRIPPVRERGRDWEIICEYYLGRLIESRRRDKRFSPEAIEVLSAYDWPGNVRELKALVDSGYYLSDGALIEPRHLLESLEHAARLDQLARVPALDSEGQCYERMTTGGQDFWEVIHRPYLDRELSRAQVRSILARGLEVSRGSYKSLLPLFGIAHGDYPRFMDFLRHHDLKPPKPGHRAKA